MELDNFTEINVRIGDELFEFYSEQNWINSAQRQFSIINSIGLTREHYICLDKLGRVCIKGMEFMRATKDDAYPIKVYSLLPLPESALKAITGD